MSSMMLATAGQPTPAGSSSEMWHLRSRCRALPVPFYRLVLVIELIRGKGLHRAPPQQWRLGRLGHDGMTVFPLYKRSRDSNDGWVFTRSYRYFKATTNFPRKSREPRRRWRGQDGGSAPVMASTFRCIRSCIVKTSESMSISEA